VRDALHTAALGAIAGQQQLGLLRAAPETVQKRMGLAQVSLSQPLRLTVQPQLLELLRFRLGGEA
jgi:hypothetical protein